MKFKRFLITFLMFAISATSALATQLPQEVTDFLFKENPKTAIRFDGLITFMDGTVYLPIFPAYTNKVEKLQITYTYPERTSFSKKPEVIIFNNNFALLKLIKTKQGVLTVSQNPDIPLTIKTGSLPQDILVPKGLVLPDTLKGILGNVQIPLLNSTAVVMTPEPQKTAPQETKTTKKNVNEKIAVNTKLKNKMYLVSNFESQYLKVFSSEQSEPLYSLKLNGVLKDMQPVCNDKYLMIITNTKKHIDVVDIHHEYIAKQIDLGVVPTEIITSNLGNKAYVASAADRSIFVIDLVEMKIKEKIKILGTPQKITINEEGTQLAYIDRASSNIYVLKLDGSYENKLVSTGINVSKLLLTNNQLYSIERTDNKFKITYYDLNKTFDDEEPIKEKQTVMEGLVSGFDTTKRIDKTLTEAPKYYSTEEKYFEIGTKPTDMIKYKDKIFILCSQSNDIFVYNTKLEKITNNIKLPTAGFSRKISPVRNSNVAMVTNVLEKKYAVIDLDKENIIQTLNINVPVNSITIIEKQ